jgi:hypothetical protein
VKHKVRKGTVVELHYRESRRARKKACRPTLKLKINYELTI